MATSFPTGKKILLGRELAYPISLPGGSRALVATLIETGPARPRSDTPELPGCADGHGIAAGARHGGAGSPSSNPVPGTAAIVRKPCKGSGP